MAWHDRHFGGYSSDEDRYEDSGYGNWGGYSNSNQRSYQQRTTKQVKRWACGRCHKDYATKANLERHIASEHAPKPKAIQHQQQRGGHGQMVPWSQQSSKFVCHFCGNEYANQGNLNRHVSQTHARNGQVAVASSSKKTTNTINIQYNIYNTNYYNCKKY